MSMDFLRHLDTILLGDCLEVLRALPDKSFDLLLTDPPYGISADKGTNGFGVAQNKKYGGGWDNCRPSREHFDEMLRVAKKSIIFGGNYFSDILPPSKCWLVWDKIGNLSFNNPFADVELIWTNFTHASKKYTVIQQGFVREDTSARIHPTQKPIKLLEAILRDHIEDGFTVLDPFSGSGTTAIAAHRLGRRFLCIEKDADYHAASVKRLAKEKEQLLLKI